MCYCFGFITWIEIKVTFHPLIGENFIKENFVMLHIFSKFVMQSR